MGFAACSKRLRLSLHRRCPSVLQLYVCFTYLGANYLIDVRLFYLDDRGDLPISFSFNFFPNTFLLEFYARRLSYTIYVAYFDEDIIQYYQI